jgi:hypothetical protein
MRESARAAAVPGVAMGSSHSARNWFEGKQKVGNNAVGQSVVEVFDAGDQALSRSRVRRWQLAA